MKQEHAATQQDVFIDAGSLVVLSGLPGSGKSSLKSRAKGFQDLEQAWISTDAIREQLLGVTLRLVEGETIEHVPQSANDSVFTIAREIVRARLAHGLTCIVDATSPTDVDRADWAQLAQDTGVPFQVLILETSLEACLAANATRRRRVPASSIREMHRAMQGPVQASPAKAKARPSTAGSGAETGERTYANGSRFAHQVISRESRLVLRRPMLEHDRYDVVGDVHGLKDDLLALLAKAGWQYADGRLSHPDGRKLLFLGDLVDRGPDSAGVVRLVRQAVLDGVARVIKGNHERKLVAFLKTARTEGIERWTSFANATTGMQFLKLADGEALETFLHELPSYQLYEGQGRRLAFVHADLHTFDAELSFSFELQRGHSSRGDASDNDARYEEGYRAGVNTWTLIRGHIPQVSEQDHVFSLERHAFQRGELVLMRLDAFIAKQVSGSSAREAFEASIVTQQCEFDFDAESERWKLAREMESLAGRKLATRQLDESKMLRVFKYSKRVFWENGWDESPWLLKARGLVLDAAGDIVSHPFDKCFNFRENGAGESLAVDTPVLAIEKLNGFLGIVSRHPLKKNELLVHTQGSFAGEFVDYVRDYLPPPVAGQMKKYLAAHDVTLMFEVLHPKDPHIIEYAEEDHGLWLIGVRGKQAGDAPWREEQVDEAAAAMGLRRPMWARTTHGELLARCRREAGELVRHEGWMVRADMAEQPFVYKLKTPYYLVTKFLGRLSASRTAHLFGNPKHFRQTLDEEFYPLVDALTTRHTREAFAALSDAERVVLVRKLVTELI